MTKEAVLPHQEQVSRLKEVIKNTPTQIVVAGASSIGKTTLCEALHHALDIPIIPEIARSIVSDNHWTRDDLHNEDTLFTLQKLIVKAQCEKERALVDTSHVSDNCIFMPLLFTQFYLSMEKRQQLEQMEEFSSVQTLYPHGLFVVIKPSIATLQDDGIRLLPGIETANAFNAELINILRMKNLSYVEITAESVEGRVTETVDQLLKFENRLEYPETE